MVRKQYHPQGRLWSKLGPVAQDMRQEPTKAEQILWESLRNRRLCGYKFRRQHAIDRFIVDFFCREAALIIEIDGPIHEKQVEEDQERQDLLTEMGFQFLRFTNDQVLHQLDDVLIHISEAINSYKRTHISHDSPSLLLFSDDLPENNNGEGAGG